MEIKHFFPIPVSYVKMLRNLDKNEIDFINNQKKLSKKNGGNLISENKYILDSHELCDLKQNITDVMNEYFKNVFEPKKGVELYITNSWLNWTENDQFHHRHCHPNSLVSGVFYINTSSSDEITFFNPNKILGNININSPEKGIFSTQTWSFGVNKNHLLLFPSTLEHGVDERPPSNNTRLSLSFNTWFKGEIGSVDIISVLKN
jgi:uncharacterized protein (TIGR02466 family)